MQHRAIKLILAGSATLAIGVGAYSTVSAVTSSAGDGISLSHANKAAAAAQLDLKQHAVETVPQAALPAAPSAPAKPALPKPAPKKPALPVLYAGKTLGSYFWDTGHSGNGDTGAPASGLPMQQGCFASPSWPMGTKGFVTYKGKTMPFFICDRGPGSPSHDGVMLDIDGMTYAKLTGGKWVEPDVIGGSGQAGNIPVSYIVTHWGNGPGKGAPQPF